MTVTLLLALLAAVSRRRALRSSMLAMAWSALLLTSACASHPMRPKQFPPQQTETRLACELRVPAEVKAGSPVPLTFALRNVANESIRFLTWLTPFEGWRGKILRVTRDGEKVEYHGIMASRDWPPPPAAWFTIVKGVELSVTLDMSQVFPMNLPGHYVIDFRGELLDTYAVREERGHKNAAVFMPCKQAALDVR